MYILTYLLASTGSLGFIGLLAQLHRYSPFIPLGLLAPLGRRIANMDDDHFPQREPSPPEFTSPTGVLPLPSGHTTHSSFVCSYTTQADIDFWCIALHSCNLATGIYLSSPLNLTSSPTVRTTHRPALPQPTQVPFTSHTRRLTYRNYTHRIANGTWRLGHVVQ